MSLTEGNVGETYSGPVVKSAFGPTISFDLFYNSYNADGSRASINTVLGYGWTHLYNEFLFSQRGNIFRSRGDGRIVEYSFVGNGTYQTSTGYFETLKQNSNGCSFNLTDRYQTQYCFQSIPGTPFLVEGPVWRLTKITDRNNNVTTLTYMGGNLTSITDTYGRGLTLAYNAKNLISSVTDPLGRVTDFTYNAGTYLLTTITDPLGKTTTYTYNYLYQIASKTDRDGRQFTLGYQNGLPYSETDGNGGKVYSLTNTSNWATDPMQLAENLKRVYKPSTTSQTDGRENIWQYSDDSNGDLLTVTAPDGATTTYTYDVNTLVASQTDADGNTSKYTYDGEGNLLSCTNANGNVTAYTYDSTFNQPLSMTDPQGRVTTYTIDSNGNRLTETDPLGALRSWTYESHGNVLTYTDKDGNASSYTYDGFGNRVQTTDALSEVTKYSYDGVGNLTSMTDADKNTTKYQYDGLNRLTLITDALNGMQQYFYDGEGDKIKEIDQNGHATSYAYDQRHRLIATTDATNHKTTYSYDGNNNRVSLTDRNGHTTTYAYDVQSRLTEVTDALGDMTQYSYDGVGNRLSETDANSHATTYKYDTLNRRTQKTDALSEVTMWVYDRPFGTLPGHPECSGPTLGSSLIIEQIDGNGKVIYYCYDGLDRLIIEIHKQGNIKYEIDPNDAVTIYTYDANSNRLTWKEPDGNITDYTYDAVNRRIKMVNAAGDTTMWTYDPFGNIKTVTAPNGNVTTLTYDALNRRVQQTDSDGPVSTWSYDPVGYVVSTADGNGNTTSYTYDLLNRRITMTDPLGHSTHYSYDPVGNLLTVTDRDGNTTSYSYDAINRRISTTTALPATTLYQYDPVGNLIKLTDANGHSASSAYDAVNRKISETYPDLAHNTVTYTFDAVGNRISRTDQNMQTTTYTYSDLYFLTSRAYPSGTDTLTYDLSGRVLTGNTNRGSGWNESFSYDGANRLIQSVQNGQTINIMYNIPGRTRSLTYPGGRIITEQKDFRDLRILTANDGGSTPIVQYTYDLSNNVLTRGYRNGTVGMYTYNANNWTCSINHNLGAGLTVGFTYAYDNEGNKFYEQKLHEPTDSEAYVYDTVYRLTNYQAGMLVSSPPPNCPSTPIGIQPPAMPQEAYTLDPLGNWNKLVTTPGGTQTRNFSPSNEITSISGYPVGSLTVSSDNNGNTLNDVLNLYCYDEENRLFMVMLKSGGGTCKMPSSIIATYQYDTFGRRVSTSVSSVTTNYYYDAWRTIEEQSSMGVTQATYVFGNYLDEVLTMDRGGQTFYYHQNNLLSVFALSDSTGKAVEGYSYDAYGYQTVILPGPDGKLDFDGDDVYLPGAKSSYGNPFLFTGQRYDPESGLLYYKARHYSTFFGRFMQRDPLDYDAQDINLYEYVKSNPPASNDPLGLQGPGVQQQIAGALAAIAAASWFTKVSLVASFTAILNALPGLGQVLYAAATVAGVALAACITGGLYPCLSRSVDCQAAAVGQASVCAQRACRGRGGFVSPLVTPAPMATCFNLYNAKFQSQCWWGWLRCVLLTCGFGTVSSDGNCEPNLCLHLCCGVHDQSPSVN